MNTFDLRPPSGAVVLFDGDPSSLEGWRNRNGGPARWRSEQGSLVVEPGTGDILSAAQFTDFQLHLEFRLPRMPDAQGQDKANSGVYLQGRYELQLLDSYGHRLPGRGDCGAVYEQHAPLLDATRPAGEWQTFDVVFRAARVREGALEERARLTLLFNGLVVHNNLELPGPTKGALDDREGEPGPLRLQDNGAPVAFRNVWAVHLPGQGSARYEAG